MACLERVRENFIEMDLDLDVMEEVYATFATFHINVSKDDVEKVDTLRFNFNKMINKVRVVARAHLTTLSHDVCFASG